MALKSENNLEPEDAASYSTTYYSEEVSKMTTPDLGTLTTS